MPDEKVIVSPDTGKKERVPPGQTAVEDMPVLHYGSVHRIDPEKWSFRIFGLVEKPLEIGYREFMSLPMVKVHSDIHCVTGWTRLNNVWEGVGTETVKKLVNVMPDARFVIVHCAGNFTTNLNLDDFFTEDALFAVKHDGKPITAEHGAPVRLVVPRLYFWKSAKWVLGLEFADTDRPGFWETRGYHNHGDPWTEERYS